MNSSQSNNSFRNVNMMIVSSVSLPFLIVFVTHPMDVWISKVLSASILSRP